MKNLQTFESFWGFGKDEEEQEYNCVEVNDLSFLDRPFGKIFDRDEKIKISLFLGDYNYITNTGVESFIYKYKTSIGFGLSKESNIQYEIECKKHYYKDGNKNVIYTLRYGKKYMEEGDIYPKEHERRYFKCGDLDSCIRKMKELKKEDKI